MVETVRAMSMPMDIGSIGSEIDGDRATDAACGSGDDGDFALE